MLVLKRIMLLLNLKVYFRFILLFYVFVSSTAGNSTENMMKVATVDWCPQVCPNYRTRPGYIIEMFELVFGHSNINYAVDVFPWSRAINYVHSGQYSALLAPSKDEAPTLVYPKIPIGFQEMCFYTLKNSLWKFSGESSLKGLSIGLAKDVSIDELKGYMEKNPHQFQIQPYHERFVNQNVNKLRKGRINTFIFNKNSVKYLKKSTANIDDIQQSGCLARKPVYLAFTGRLKDRKKARRFAKFYDQNIQRTELNNGIDKILSNYKTGITLKDLLKHNSSG